MAIPTRAQLLTLDHHYNGLPFVRVAAKAEVDPDTITYQGLPFFATPDEGGGEPPPPTAPRTHMALVQTAPPVTATTIARETGDVLLMEEQFTLIEETGDLDSNLATVELFIGSTPTGGNWVLSRDYRTGARTDGVLRSPLPSVGPVSESATLTLVASAPNTKVSFDWGVRGMFFGSPVWSDALRFFVDEVELMVKYPVDIANDPIDLATGSFSFVRPAGTYQLRWQWSRVDGIESYSDRSHAWITNLIIDPKF